jgi:hypothetical protein
LTCAWGLGAWAALPGFSGAMVVDLAAVSLAKACDVGSLGASHGFLLPPLLRFRSHGCRGFRFGRTGLIFLSQLEQCLGGVLVQYCACQSAVAFRLLPEELCLIDHCHSTAAVARSAAKAPPLRACGREQCGAVSVGGKPPIRARSFCCAAARPQLAICGGCVVVFQWLASTHAKGGRNSRLPTTKGAL